MSLSDELFKGRVKNSKMGDPFPIEEWEAERESVKTVTLQPPKWAVDHRPVTVILHKKYNFQTGRDEWEKPTGDWKPITEREMKLLKGRDWLYGSEIRELRENAMAL